MQLFKIVVIVGGVAASTTTTDPMVALMKCVDQLSKCAETMEKTMPKDTKDNKQACQWMGATSACWKGCCDENANKLVAEMNVQGKTAGCTMKCGEPYVQSIPRVGS